MDRYDQTGAPDSQERAQAARDAVPETVLADVLTRRTRNLTVLLSLVAQASRGEVDGLLIGQDDAAEYGLTRRDLRAVESAILNHGAAARAWVTYGTDELAVRLLARAWLAAERQTPPVRVVYAYPDNRDAIPRYEGQSLDRTLSSHLATAGARRVQRDDALTLFVHNFPGAQQEAPSQEPYDPRALAPFLTAVEAAAAGEHPFAVADVRYSNGADRLFVPRLLAVPRASAMRAYGGWNTSSNTIGMALAQALLPSGPDSQAFTLTRFLDDWAYQADVRQRLRADVVPRFPGATPERLGSALGTCAEAARQWLEQDYTPALAACFGRRITVSAVGFPWERLFEIELEVAAE
jgi:hypothetical protein